MLAPALYRTIPLLKFTRYHNAVSSQIGGLVSRILPPSSEGSTTLLYPKMMRNLLLGGARKLKWNLLTLKRERKRGRRLLVGPSDVRNKTVRT